MADWPKVHALTPLSRLIDAALDQPQPTSKLREVLQEWLTAMQHPDRIRPPRIKDD